MLEMADAIKPDTMVQVRHGHLPRTALPRRPALLRGYVELIYDINNHPAVRFH